MVASLIKGALAKGQVDMSGRNPKQPRKGRGAISNPPSRYSATSVEPIDDGWFGGGAEHDKLRTKIFKDVSRSIITYNESPDISFDRSINPFRGCEHACTYCFARPTHAYSGCRPAWILKAKSLRNLLLQNS